MEVDDLAHLYLDPKHCPFFLDVVQILKESLVESAVQKWGGKKDPENLHVFQVKVQ